MSYRDVTELLRVDPDVADPDDVGQAVRVIRTGDHVTVADDETATKVLVALGLTAERAAFRIRMSHGPMA